MTAPRTVSTRSLRTTLLAPLAALAAVALWLTPAAPAGAQEAGDDDSAAAPAAAALDVALAAGIAADAPAAIDVPIATRANTHFEANDWVEFDGVANDLWIVGQTVEISGRVLDNAFVAGQTVDLAEATIDGDLLVAGESVTIGGAIGGDVYAVGSRLRFTEGSAVAGDVWCGGEVLTFEGSVGGTVECGAGRATLAGAFADDVSMDVGALTVDAAASFDGALDYKSPEPGEIDGAAAVAGGVTYTESSHDHDADDDDEGGGVIGWMLKHLWFLIGAFVVGCAMIAIGRRGMRRIAAAMADQPGASLGIGFVAMLLIPAAALIAIALILTLQLGVVTLVLWAVSLYLATVLAGYTLGELLLVRAFAMDDPSPYLALAAGLVALHALMAIPYFGVLIHAAAIAAGLGAVYVAARDRGTAPEEIV